MKIAQIAPLTERVPPRKYGGTERVISVVTEELVRRGHEVTLFASGDSVTRARLISTYPTSLRDSGIENIYEKNTLNLMHIGHAYSMQHEFDIIHDHNGILSLPTAINARVPTVFTLHGALTDRAIEAFRMHRASLVSISYAQRAKAPDLNYVGNVYNGLPLDEYPFSAEREDFLLFVGRIAKEKGIHFAIEAARKAGRKLIIAAKLDARDKEYFEEYIRPHLNERQIQWIGEVNEEERNRLMQRAYAFLHPVTWPEPFGLTLIEATACGCPVIAFREGSIPEVIQDTKTGFIVKNVDEMVAAIGKVDTINRKFASTYVKMKFSEVAMVDNYLHVYERVLSNRSYEPSSFPFLKGYVNSFLKTILTPEKEYAT